MLTVVFLLAVVVLVTAVSMWWDARRPRDTRHASLRYADKLKARNYRADKRAGKGGGGSFSFGGDWGGGGGGGGGDGGGVE